MAHRLPALVRRITGHRGHGDTERVTFNDGTGEVCDDLCRRITRLDSARTTAAAASLGYRI